MCFQHACCNLGVRSAVGGAALQGLCCAIASSDFMLSNLLDNSYSPANVNKFQLDRPKTCRCGRQTDSLPRRAGAQQRLELDSLAFSAGCAFFSLTVPMILKLNSMKRKSWQLFAVFGLVGLLLAAVVSCGKPAVNSQANNTQEIEFWTMQLQPQFTEYFNKTIADFEAQNPGVKVRWVDVPWSAWKVRFWGQWRRKLRRMW